MPKLTKFFFVYPKRISTPASRLGILSYVDYCYHSIYAVISFCIITATKHSGFSANVEIGEFAIIPPAQI